MSSVTLMSAPAAACLSHFAMNLSLHASINDANCVTILRWNIGCIM
jgi:hypothetical protein